MDSIADIAQTASLVNESRRRREDISRDCFAQLWVLESASATWDEMAREVGHSDVELPIRNRYFLDRLDYYLAIDQIAIFVNIGAGFTSYPFLTARACPSVEVDLPHVIEFKRQHVEKWRHSGKLPDREVRYVATDLTERQRVEGLLNDLSSFLQNRPSFVLLEGLTYYLPVETRRELFEDLAALQTPGSILAFDFWNERSLRHELTLRWRRYLARKGWHDEHAYSAIEIRDVACLRGYRMLELANAQILAGILAPTGPASTAVHVLPEYYTVLQKI